MKKIEIETILVKNVGGEYVRHIDISPTVMARDWKGWNNYGSVAVVTYEREDSNDCSGNAT